MKSAEQAPRLHRVFRVLMVLCAVGFLCSAFILLADRRQYTEGDAVYRQLRTIGEVSSFPPAAFKGSTPKESPAKESPRAASQKSAGINFSALQKKNPDVTAWIVAGGKKIDYPVVQGKDNVFYLHHLATGERNKLGAIFMDARSRRDFSDRNTVLYGHNMKNGSMFSSLNQYKEQRYYHAFPTMRLETPVGNFTVVLFAGLVVDGNEDSIRMHFRDDLDFQAYIADLKKESTFHADTEVTKQDRILTLCTCTYEFENARYAVFGKLIPES